MLRLCPKCGGALSPSDLPQYPYLCEECDENFFEWETYQPNVTGAALVCWLGAQMDSFEEYMNNNIGSDPDYYGYDENTLYKLLNYVAEVDDEILEEEYRDCRE